MGTRLELLITTSLAIVFLVSQSLKHTRST